MFASDVELVLALPGTTATINSSKTRTLTLKPVNGKVEITIGNEVLTDILFPGEPRDPVHDFELLFRLTADKGHVHVPTPCPIPGIKKDCHSTFLPAASY